MARLKRRRRGARRFSGTPEQHGNWARQIVKAVKNEFRGARDALARAAKPNTKKKTALCASALDYMMSGNAAKAALFRERVWARHGERSHPGAGLNRVSESLKHKFRQVCLKHPRTSKTGHW